MGSKSIAALVSALCVCAMAATVHAQSGAPIDATPVQPAETVIPVQRITGPSGHRDTANPSTWAPTSDRAAEGLPTPPRHERRSNASALAGGLTFAGFYLPVAIIGIAGAGGGTAATLILDIPIFGPAIIGFAMLALGPSSWFGSTFTALGAVLVVDSIGQAIGLGFLIAGANARSSRPSSSTHHARPLQWALLPGGPGSSLGATLTIVGF